VGKSVGASVGDFVGDSVGLIEGESVGGVGALDGLNEGLGVGLNDSSQKRNRGGHPRPPSRSGTVKLTQNLSELMHTGKGPFCCAQSSQAIAIVG
jgi:hypothetical protein